MLSNLYAVPVDLYQLDTTRSVLFPYGWQIQVVPDDLYTTEIQDLMFENLADYPPDYYKTIQEIVEAAGYKYEEHHATTKDGYVLTMMRVCQHNLPKGSPVIFMQHGLFDSANAWVQNTVEKSPAFIFAKMGYDVWLGNNRGTSYSRQNTHIDPDTDEQAFFTYDFEKLGQYDLVAQLDHARKIHGVKKVTYFGHSQGTSQVFYGLATNEAYLKDRINLVVAFAPILRLGNTTDKILATLAKGRPLFESTIKTLGLYELMGKDWQNIKGPLCAALPPVCDLVDSFISGSSPYNDADRYKASLSKFPNAISWRELSHYAQEVNSGKYEKFDYGETANLQIYGTKTPPEIDITKIQSVPIAMFVGKQDTLANEIDCKWAASQIKTTVHYQEIDNCDHGSYLLGKDVSFMFDVINLVQKYNGKVKIDAEQPILSDLQELYLY